MTDLLALKRVGASEIPAAYLEIAWRRFFADRGRGLSLAAHFPWLEIPSERNHAVLAGMNDPLGMLILRLGQVAGPGGKLLRIGGIGLVCTAPGRERRGTGSDLIRYAVQLGQECRVDALLLWTGQPEFYQRLGFQLADSRRVTVMQRSGAAASGLGRVPLSQSPLSESGVFAGPRGVPPFANDVFVLEHGSSAAVFATLPGGIGALLDWEGPLTELVELAARASFDRLVVNDHGPAQLTSALVEAGWTGTTDHRPLAMWKPLSADCPSEEELATVAVSPLDRF